MISEFGEEGGSHVDERKKAREEKMDCFPKTRPGNLTGGIQ